MFGNFIYFIVALLVYATYQPPETPYFSPAEAVLLFASAAVLFAGYTRLVFVRLERRAPFEGPAALDHRFGAALTRQSILAIALFAADVYGIGLSAYLYKLQPFATVPTLLALVFLALFIAYMSVVWYFAYPLQRRLYTSDVSRRSYVLSNISFTVPVLLPWLILSGVSDLIYALPYDLPRRILDTSWGEAVYFLIFLVAVAVIGPAMIQKFWRCTPLEPGFFRERIAAVCRRAGIRYTDILYWPIFGGRMITAGVMGLIQRFRYILITRALLRFLEPDEIDAVIAHEIGHVKKRHLLFYLFFFVGYMVVSYATFDMIIYVFMFIEPLYGAAGRLGIAEQTVSSVVMSLMLILIFMVYFRFIFGYFMRNFERQADTYVFSLFDSARPLITTLEKIAVTSGQSADKPNWHHFSIRQRVEFLSRCESDRRWIDRHDRTIRKSIAVYLAGVACVAVVGYQVGYGEPGRRLSARALERVIVGRLEAQPDNPELYRLLGDLQYGRSNYSGALEAYEKAISLNPGDPQVLNNLAWLYATCETRRLRNPERALELARQAAKLDAAPHILDTLAEAYFANGRVGEAVETARRALELARENRSYYEGQLEKFAAAQHPSAGLEGR